MQIMHLRPLSVSSNRNMASVHCHYTVTTSPSNGTWSGLLSMLNLIDQEKNIPVFYSIWPLL